MVYCLLPWLKNCWTNQKDFRYTDSLKKHVKNDTLINNIICLLEKKLTKSSGFGFDFVYPSDNSLEFSLLKMLYFEWDASSLPYTQKMKKVKWSNGVDFNSEMIVKWLKLGGWKYHQSANTASSLEMGSPRQQIDNKICGVKTNLLTFLAEIKG